MAQNNVAGSQEVRDYVALCPAGFEEKLSEELRVLGCKGVRPLRGSVTFQGPLALGYRACIWSRLASRIVLQLERVGCTDAQELYDDLGRIAWEDHVPRGATIAVDARGGNDALHDRRYAAMVVKDAVCDRLRDVRGERPSIDTETPDVKIVCTVRDRRATVGIDLGGSSLVDHGYRVPARSRAAAGRASFVREDMAGLILMLGDWGKRCSRSDSSTAVDPLGSSPVLAVEAACIACDRAPRLARRHWGFAGWGGHDDVAWKSELSAAQARFDAAKGTGRRVVVACTDPGVRSEISEMARRVGVADVLDVQPCGPAGLQLGDRALSNPLVVAAMPDEGVTGLMGDLPARLAAVAALTRSEALAEAPVVAMTSSDLLGFAMGIEPDAYCNVINGKEDVSIQIFPSAAQAVRRAQAEGLEPPKPAMRAAVEGAAVLGGESPAGLLHRIELPGGSEMGVLVPTSDQFAHRLAKNVKARAKWAEREGVTCYRVYDADLPDYAVTVDLYQGGAQTPGRWLVMSEYAAPREIDPNVAQRRLADALAIAPRVFGIDPEDVFLKVRRKAKGGSQYADRNRQGRTALVEEGGLVFEVNFSDYLDTGLFLDHRIVRRMVGERAEGGRFLNLFAYTGSATCYAAAGGARETTTVDLSNTYLDWARRNMEQNGFAGPRHEFVQADVLGWINEQRHSPMRWDLIYIDPPTFSNSARMRKSGFDVQEDHAELLIGASRLLVRGGTIVFSCNLRGFAPDAEKLRRAGVLIEDVTAGTIPYDYERNAKIHHCYLVRRTD